ncbi:Piso0_002136 [Millerozyma farinosa CBS 7064]|uniref:Piso0_002136 protein n=1 Tax=Pichia sorbitophila (strain ATCC MYA-4447 / BCRC 22081 / CBS 7064 / NBRC 10061 / NRRL Y-12695) TaxID=559304 RepID=G8YBT0_PICSO|nr:Piso0_002136 [Millerozyma farinosa CBS 7064]
MFEFIKSWFQAEPVPESIKTEVKSLVDTNNIMVFSKSYCPYCKSTKSLLDGYSKNYKVVELDEVDNGSVMQRALQELTGQRTVPNVFINKKHIGGNSDLQNLQAKGALASLIE